MDEEEIEEWYNGELDRFTEEYFANIESGKNIEDCKKILKDNIHGLRKKYYKIYDEYLEKLRLQRKEKRTLEAYKRFKSNLKKAKNTLNYLLKRPFNKWEEYKESPEFQIKHHNFKVSYDLKKFKTDIWITNFLEEHHLSYPLFLIRRYFRKMGGLISTKIDSFKTEIENRYSDLKIALKEWLLNLREKTIKILKTITKLIKSEFSKVVTFFKEIYSKLGSMFKKRNSGSSEIDSSQHSNEKNPVGSEKENSSEDKRDKEDKLKNEEESNPSLKDNKN